MEDDADLESVIRYYNLLSILAKRVNRGAHITVLKYFIMF